MLGNDLVADRDKGLVRALAALHLRLIAEALNPFIAADRAITLPAGFRVLPSPRENVGSAAKQTAE
jgi:hypothetical protein